MGTLILSVAIAGATSAVMAGVRTTQRAEGITVSGQLARRVLEETRGLGFYGAPEGSSTRLFDANGGAVSLGGADTGLVNYSVTTTVTSDLFEVVNGVVKPNDAALRSVVVTVRDANGRVLDAIGTTLARGGL